MRDRMVKFIYFIMALLKINNSFYYEEIPLNIQKEMLNVSYFENNEISFDDLVLVHILYIGFDMREHKGELVVNKKIASDILDIFKVLYLNKYEIESVERIDKYNGDDNLSMENNNTSAFNYRYIENTNILSNHSYGLAIDINPLYNPYVYKKNNLLVISPKTAFKYIDRNKKFKHKIDKDDLAYKEFIKHGFIWGGNWNNKKDYQHFEKVN